MTDVSDRAEEPIATGRSWARVAGKILLGALALLVLLFVLLAGSVWLDRRGAAERVAAVANTAIPGASGPDVSAYVSRPARAASEAGEPAPAVVLVHEFWGLNQDMREKSDLLADQDGYTVVAPDVLRGRSTNWLPSAIWQVSTVDPEEINVDLDAVLSWLRSQPDVDPERIAIVGFCFGGRTAMLYSLHEPTLDGTVVFYGNPVMDPDRLRALRGPVLGIFGEADRSIPLEDVEAFRASLEEAGVESTVTVYPGQGHAFVDSIESIEAGGAQGAAWNEMRDFLRAVFEGGSEEAGVNTPARAPAAGSPSAQPASDRLGWTYIIRLGLSHAGSEGAVHDPTH